MVRNNMLGTQDAFFVNLNAPQVIEERNRLVAAQLGKELGYGAEKMQKMFSELTQLSGDPKRMLETLYVQLWPKKKMSRDDIQGVINRCHEEALAWFQETHPELLVG
jgi:hypothetical protein